MLLSNLEYIPMRLARRFLFRDAFLLRFGKLVPHYRVNRNQADPRPLIADYARHLSSQSFDPAGRSVLEIGVGATNSTGYEFVARFNPERIFLFEPFVALAAHDDDALLNATATRNGRTTASIAGSISRLDALAGVPDASIDLVLSSSVLEHVGSPDSLFDELHRILKPDGTMLHLVDYRDHFFKYPLHFLQFSRGTWERFLNPGDLPRWRVYDHLEQLTRAGFDPRILNQTREDAAFARIAPQIAGEFRRDHPLLAVGTAALWATVSQK